LSPSHAFDYCRSDPRPCRPAGCRRPAPACRRSRAAGAVGGPVFVATCDRATTHRGLSTSARSDWRTKNRASPQASRQRGLARNRRSSVARSTMPPHAPLLPSCGCSAGRASSRSNPRHRHCETPSTTATLGTRYAPQLRRSTQRQTTSIDLPQHLETQQLATAHAQHHHRCRPTARQKLGRWTSLVRCSSPRRSYVRVRQGSCPPPGVGGPRPSARR
jgi:hypothetical protein